MACPSQPPCRFDTKVESQIQPGEKPADSVNPENALMHALFYKYASSRAENPLVDKHDIEHALTAWSWFWVFVEGVAYFGAGAVVAYLVGSRNLAVGFAAVSIALVVLALVQRARLNRYARPQIDTIASDPTAAYEIKSRFDAL
jgi:hypothetical protein